MGSFQRTRGNNCGNVEQMSVHHKSSICVSLRPQSPLNKCNLSFNLHVHLFTRPEKAEETLKLLVSWSRDKITLN